MPTYDDGRSPTIPDPARARAAKDFDSLTEAPFDWGGDPEAIIAESRRVSDALRVVFGTCEMGATDLHVLGFIEGRPGLTCDKCRLVFVMASEAPSP